MKQKNRYLLSEMRRGTLTGRTAWTGLLFITPWLIGATIFFAYPLYRSLLLSMSDVETLQPLKVTFRGWHWYKEALFADINFLPRLLKTSMDNLINLPLINVFAMISALLLNRKIKARGMFRAMYFLPVILGTGFIVQQLLGQDISGSAVDMTNGMLIPRSVQAYLGHSAMEIIQQVLNRLTIVMWNSGVQIIIYLAALQSIPSSLYEAARVDSAGEWESFWLITLPLLAPMIQLNLVFTTISLFTMADNPVLDFIQWLAFETKASYNYVFSCAVGWIYSLFVLLVVGVLFFITRRFVENVKEDY